MTRAGQGSYIVLEFGVPSAVTELTGMERVTRLAVVERTWDQVRAFSREHEFEFHVSSAPILNTLQRVLAHTFYNPWETIRGEWVRTGRTGHARIIELVEAAVTTDDDLITQWFSPDQVLRLLRAANSWEELVVAVDAVRGAHEAEQDAAEYVERVLGSDWGSQ